MTYDQRGLAIQIEEILTKHPQTTLKALSDRLGVERHTLEKSLIKCKGVSFRDFKRKMMVQLSLRLLGDPTKSIKEIGFEVGYATSQGFSRFFKRATGHTPSQIRNLQEIPRSYQYWPIFLHLGH